MANQGAGPLFSERSLRKTCITNSLPAKAGRLGRRLKVASMAAYDEFLNSQHWPLGAAIVIVLLVAMVAIVMGYNWIVERRFKQVFQ